MTSFGYRSNPRYAIKVCSSCGTLYTRDCVCSIGTVEENILVPKPPKNYARCTRCGYLVDGLNCQGCALLRQELEENLESYSPDFQSTSEPSNATESPFTLDSTPTYVDESPIVFNPPPQPLVVTIKTLISRKIFKLFHNNILVVMIAGLLMTLTNQYTVKHPIFNAHNSYLDSQIQLNSTLAKIKDQTTSITSLCEMACQVVQKKLEEKQLEEERAAKAKYWKLFVCYDDDDDEERSDSLDDNIFFGLPSFSSITPNKPALSTEEPDNSLRYSRTYMCDVPSHENSPPLDVSKDQFEDFFESNEEFSLNDDDSFSFDNIDYVEASPPDFELVSSEVKEIVILEVGGIKASNDNPISFYDPIISGTPSNLTPSGESDFFLEGDMLLFKAFLNDDHSSDFKTKSSSTSLNSLLEETNNFNKSLPKFTTFLNVLCNAECESDSSDDQSFFDEDVLEKIVSKPLCEEEIIPMKSLRTHDSSLLISSKIDSLLDEFAGELTLLKSIPSGIDETDCDFEEDIRLIEKLLYDNSFPHPSEEFVSLNSDAKIKSFSPFPILVKDSDFLMEEIDLFCTPDYPMPSGIVDKDFDSKRDILIRKDLPSINALSFAEKESFHFDIPSFSCPPAKPPDGFTSGGIS
nr:hypothetical protein [Tanacetum cinerariifolium]